MKQKEGFADANVMFFLLHELPHDLQGQGAERSRPHAGPRRQAVPGRIPQARALGAECLSWTYFKVFEPLGLALWDTHDPVRRPRRRWAAGRCERTTFFFGNFQIITATKH